MPPHELSGGHTPIIYHQHPMARVNYGLDSNPNAVLMNNYYPQNQHDIRFEQS